MYYSIVYMNNSMQFTQSQRNKGVDRYGIESMTVQASI